MKYVQFYNIAQDELFQVEFSDDIRIPEGKGVRFSDIPFPFLRVVKEGNDDARGLVVQNYA